MRTYFYFKISQLIYFMLFIPPPLIFVFTGIFIKFLPHLGLLLPMHFTASVVAIVAVIVASLGVWEFHKHQTTINPYDLEKTDRLVTSGIYRVSRNPMYLSLLLFLVAEVLWLGKPTGFLGIIIFILWMNMGQIKEEEKILTDKFTEDYLNYRKKVRRWL